MAARGKEGLKGAGGASPTQNYLNLGEKIQQAWKEEKNQVKISDATKPKEEKSWT